MHDGPVLVTSRRPRPLARTRPTRFRAAAARAALRGPHRSARRQRDLLLSCRQRPAPCNDRQAGQSRRAAIREECHDGFTPEFRASCGRRRRGAVASPAIAQQPTIKWRLTSSFPKSDRRPVGRVADGRQVRQRDERRQVRDRHLRGRARSCPACRCSTRSRTARSNAATPIRATTSARIPALIFDGSLPFGLTARQHNAWYMFGDGKKLIDEMYDGLGVVSIPMGNTGGQSFGWFRKEIEDAGGLQRHQDARRGLRRTRAAEARRRAAADRGRRHLSGAGEGHDRRGRVGRAARRREARLPQGREVHAHSGRARAVRQQLPVHQQGQMGRAAGELPGDAARGLRLRADGDARLLRRARTPRRSPAWSRRARSWSC